MKATTLLEHQHRNLQVLVEAVERGSAGMRASLLPQLAGDLAAHIAVEEQVFLPAARAALREDDATRASSDLCALARESLQRTLEAIPDSADFTRAIGELRGLVDRHAEEDLDRVFPRVEQALDAAAMRALGASMAELYDAQVEAGYGLD